MLHLPLNWIWRTQLYVMVVHMWVENLFFHFVKINIPWQVFRKYAVRRFLMYNKVYDFSTVIFVWNIWQLFWILFLQVISNDAYKQLNFFLICYDTKIPHLAYWNSITAKIKKNFFHLLERNTNLHWWLFIFF